MTLRLYEVSLRGDTVGTLTEDNDGRIGFRFSPAYRESPVRPVLSQSFEDNLERTYWGKRPGRLPSFFGNLLPEGKLRSVLETSFGVSEDDDLGLLAAVGHDLPGAVTLRLADADSVEIENAPVGGANGNGDDRHEGLRFSLAGVQLKFSMSRAGERFTLPAHDEKGDWIVKIGSPEYPGSAANEYAMMSWSRAAGFDVPDIQLLQPDAVSAIRRHLPDAAPVFAVRRYDRISGESIHQEDFAQMIGAEARRKYDGSYDQLGLIVRTLLGDDSYREFIRRLALAIAIGNSDAHLKNWSLIYPDKRKPQLAPVYDQVATIAWPQLDRRLALKFAGTKEFGRVGVDSFQRLARKAGGDPDEAARIAGTTAQELRTSWAVVRDKDVVPTEHAIALVNHWRNVPLLREAGGLGE